MKCIRDQAELATGDPNFCKQCEAAFNVHSIIEESKENEEQVWVCEFCDHRNIISIEQEEKPKTDTVSYML